MTLDRHELVLDIEIKTNDPVNIQQLAFSTPTPIACDHMNLREG